MKTCWYLLYAGCFTVIPPNLCNCLRVLVVDLNFGKEETGATKYSLFSQGLKGVERAKIGAKFYLIILKLLPLEFSGNSAAY